MAQSALVWQLHNDSPAVVKFTFEVYPSARSAGASRSQDVSGSSIRATARDTADSDRYACRSREQDGQTLRCASSALVGCSSASAAKRSADRCDISLIP